MAISDCGDDDNNQKQLLLTSQFLYILVTLVMTLVVIMVIGHNMDDVEPGHGHGDDGEAGWVGQG